MEVAGWVESTAVSTLHRSIEKYTPKKPKPQFISNQIVTNIFFTKLYLNLADISLNQAQLFLERIRLEELNKFKIGEVTNYIRLHF